MEKWPVGVFVSVDAGLGVKLEVAHELGIKSVQVHTPHRQSRTPEQAEAFLSKLNAYGITVSCVFLGFDGESYASIAKAAETVGFVPKATRAARLAESREISDFTKLLGVHAIGSHIGFVPHDRNSSDYKEMVAAIKELCDYLKGNGQRLHLETGQEKAENLLAFINDVGCDNLFINFDPANLILYGMGDPIGSLKAVGHLVRSVHCKDGTTTSGVKGVDWGCEVPFGQGEVNAKNFLATLKEIGYDGPLTIEREIPEEPERQKSEITQALTLIESIKQELFS
ncbi:MAG: sugar phosphate isomerase/epimerase family protein [Planctomycetia bacterium]|nr:sugar phosphate isomerase/epimerase family protein [Planctomycetia bacterium]